MKIVITTGIYPPAIGGPAQYAKNLAEAFRSSGYQVKVLTYRLEKYLPIGVRHFWFYLRCLVGFLGADLVIALDTLSVGWPSVCAGRLLNKKVIIRTGGDFLWESYVERSGDQVLLRNFYRTSLAKLSVKERLIFKITKFTLANVSKLVFSTEWQRQIWAKPYRLDLTKTGIVENYFGPKEVSFPPVKKNFIAGTRPLKWKNDSRLAVAFARVKEQNESLEYDNSTKPFGRFMDVLARAYAVILASLGDVSPNLILDSIRHNKPFIVTKETGLYERIKPCAIFVDPENIDDIASKIEWLSNPKNYEEQKKKVEAFNFLHTWEDIAREFLTVARQI